MISMQAKLSSGLQRELKQPEKDVGAKRHERRDVTHGELSVRGNIMRSWQKLQIAPRGLAGFLRWLRGTYVRSSQTTQIAGGEHQGHSGK